MHSIEVFYNRNNCKRFVWDFLQIVGCDDPVDLLTRWVRLPWWRHQMEAFSALLAICAGNSLVTGEFPTQSLWRGALKFSLIYAWMNDWVNNRDAGDLQRHRAHYVVTVMIIDVGYGRNRNRLPSVNMKFLLSRTSPVAFCGMLIW